MPHDIIPPIRTKWFEGYIITMHQLGTGTCVHEIVDAYDDDYYET